MFIVKARSNTYPSQSTRYVYIDIFLAKYIRNLELFHLLLYFRQNCYFEKGTAYTFTNKDTSYEKQLTKWEPMFNFYFKFYTLTVISIIIPSQISFVNLDLFICNTHVSRQPVLADFGKYSRCSDQLTRFGNTPELFDNISACP